MAESDVDCEAGRALGCKTFCCRLLVRLAPDERRPTGDGSPPKGFIEKRPDDGLCVHLDRANHRCDIWAERPRVCREYHCNDDEMLAAAIAAEAVTSIVTLAKAAARIRLPIVGVQRVPLVAGRRA